MGAPLPIPIKYWKYSNYHDGVLLDIHPDMYGNIVWTPVAARTRSMIHFKDNLSSLTTINREIFILKVFRVKIFHIEKFL